MTIKRAWEGLLEGAARSFLDHYWEDEYVDTDAEVEVWTSMLEKLTKRMKARFHDEWLTLRAEKVKESFADAGHPDTEKAAAEADYRGDSARELSDDRIDSQHEAAEAARSGA